MLSLVLVNISISLNYSFVNKVPDMIRELYVKRSVGDKKYKQQTKIKSSSRFFECWKIKLLFKIKKSFLSFSLSFSKFAILPF